MSTINNLRITAMDLDDRICRHISRGSQEAYEIISTYHTNEVAKIRNYMLDVLSDDFIYDARMLNSAFHMAIVELNINLEALLSKDVVVVSPKITNKRMTI